jgi:hypothetical protein
VRITYDANFAFRLAQERFTVQCGSDRSTLQCGVGGGERDLDQADGARVDPVLF